MTGFVWLLVSLSVSGSLLAAVVFAASLLLKKRPALRYYLWLVVALRLLLPVAPGDNAMARLFTAANSPAPRAAVVRLPQDEPADTPVKTEADADPLPVTDAGDWIGTEHQDEYYTEIVRTTRRLADFGAARVLAYIWAFGACSVLFPHLFGLFELRRTLRLTGRLPSPEQQAALDAVWTGRRAPLLRRSRSVDTPITLGVFCPMIVLPDRAYTDGELHYILLHETTHVRRLDVAYKWLMLLAVSAHWFNPLVRGVNRLVDRACEQACDAAVVRDLSESERLAYCETLLNAAAASRRQELPAATLGEDARELKNRMAAALDYRAATRRVRVLAGVLFAAVCVLGLALGCTTGESDAAENEEISAMAANDWTALGEFESNNQDMEARAAIGRMSEAWAQALESRDSDRRRAMMAENMLEAYPGDAIFEWMNGHEDCRLREYTIHPYAMWWAEDVETTVGSADVIYTLIDDQMNLYFAKERLEFSKQGGAWQICDQYLTEGFVFSSRWDAEYVLRQGNPIVPRYTEEELARIKKEQSSVYGLNVADAAVQMLHLEGGTAFARSKPGEVWYEWDDGRLGIQMEKPAGCDFWVVESLDWSFRMFDFGSAQSMILEGLPGNYEVENDGGGADWHRCKVLKDGEYQCTLLVSKRSGEIKYCGENEVHSPYRDAPIYDAVMKRSAWDGEFYRSGEPGGYAIERTGEESFRLREIGGDGTAYGRISGNQGWTEDGRMLVVWCANGYMLDVHELDETGALTPDREMFYSDKFFEDYGGNKIPV